MTPQEAIETIKIAIAEVEWDYPMDYTVAFEEAITALEKQIPKKPVVYMITVEKTREGESREIISEAHCPRCGVNILFPRGCGSKYCDECGQKLDWSEVEE